MRVVCGALIREGSLLATRRGPAMRHAGRWELPGGKVEPGEDDATALARELSEELDLRVTVDALLGEAVTSAGAGELRLVAYLVTSLDMPVLHEHDAARWLTADTLEDVVWADGDVPLLPALRAALQRDGA